MLKHKTFRVDGPRGFSFLKKLGKNVWKSYVSNRLSNTGIHNDLGASFTHIQRMGDKIIKRAETRGEDKLRDEIKWILKLQHSAFGKKYLPKIHRYSLEPGNVYYEMKYYSYPNLRKIIFEDMNTTYFLKLRWEKILKVVFKQLYREKNAALPKSDFFKRTHLDKYYSRMQETLGLAPFFKEIFDSPLIVVNGKEFINPTHILQKIETSSSLVNKLTPQKLYLTHGDLHCNNILCGISAGQFILLDCRGKSPAGDLYFDPAYDLAKLYHDLHSYYSLIEKGYFRVYYNENPKRPELEYFFTNQTLVERFNRNYFHVRTHVEKRYKHFKGLHYRADFTEAMLYLTMLPMHVRREEEGLICFITGLVRLNQWLIKHHPDLQVELYQQIHVERDRGGNDS